MSDDHQHHHHHDHDSQGELSFDEKIEKMLSHWIKHNEDHASNYRNWAEKAKANGKDKAGVSTISIRRQHNISQQLTILDVRFSILDEGQQF
jgi:hypothetical protein